MMDQLTTDEMVLRHSKRINFLGPNGCWVWEGQVSSWGYGIVTLNRSKVPIHRLFYMMFVGDIPEGLVVDHMCRNRLCVNPNHLQAITHSENVALGRTRNTHCPHGHSLDDAYIKNGHRSCRSCKQAYNRMAYHRRRGQKAEV